MSSFVIGKEHYIRVAGLLTGISESSKGSYRPLWIYDWETHRNMIGEDYHRKLTACYELNIDSVCKQYADDPEDYADENTYMEEFTRYMQIGLRLTAKKDLREALQELTFFARSVSYQIEDEVDNMVVMSFLNKIIAELVAMSDPDIGERNSWGKFELKGMEEENVR